MKTNYTFLFIVLSTLAVFIVLHSFKYISTGSQATFLPPSNPSPTISQPSPSVFSSSSATYREVIKATYGPPDGFTPTQFTVKLDIPVRLEVAATEDGIGCMGSLMVPDFSSQIEFFEKDKTSIIEFTPTTSGLHYITCGMGIPHANLIVSQ